MISGQIHFIGGNVQGRISGGEAVGGGRRGTVQGFSHASRRRLFDLVFGMVGQSPFQSVPSVGAFHLLTLTYSEWLGPTETKNHLREFIRRVQRIYGESVWAVWRMEAQRRGAPHYHILLPPFACSDVDLARIWGSVVGPRCQCDYGSGETRDFIRRGRGVQARSGIFYSPIVQLESCLSGWRAVSYVSKYVGKTSLDVPSVPPSIVRRFLSEWLGPAAGGSERGYLDLVAYLRKGGWGRHWGVIGRRSLGLVRDTVQVGSEGVCRFRRAVRQVFGYQSIRTMVVSPDWVRFLSLCVGETPPGWEERRAAFMRRSGPVVRSAEMHLLCSP